MEDMMAQLPNPVLKPSIIEITEAMEALYDDPNDASANEVLDRLTSHNSNAASRRTRPEVREVIQSDKAFAMFEQFMDVLTDENAVKFSHIYGYQSIKKILLHNIILQTIAIHSGYEVEGSTPQSVHNGILFFGPSGKCFFTIHWWPNFKRA